MNMRIGLFALCAVLVLLLQSISRAEEIPSGAKTSRLSWEAFWKDVTEKNHLLKAQDANVEATSHETVQELPPPTISAGSMGGSGPFSNVMERSIGITQKVPFPTKFIKASNVKSAREDLAQTRKSLEIKKIKEKAASYFIALYGVLNETDLLKEKQGIFERHFKTLKSLTLSSQIQQIHLWEIESEVKLIANEIKERDFEEGRLRQELASLLGEENAVRFLPELPQSIEPPLALTHKTASRLETQLGLKTESLLSAERALTRQAWTPDLVFSFTNRNRLDGLMPNNQEFMVGLELPFLWGWQPARENARSTALLEKSHFEALQTASDTSATLKTQKEKLKLYWDQWNTLTKDILPATEKRVRFLHRITPSDMETLDLHRNTLTQYVNLRLKALKLEIYYRQLSAEISIQEEFSK